MLICGKSSWDQDFGMILVQDNLCINVNLHLICLSSAYYMKTSGYILPFVLSKETIICEKAYNVKGTLLWYCCIQLKVYIRLFVVFIICILYDYK